MGIAELTLLSLGLATDAFSVSVCKGLSMKKINLKGAFVTSLFFGIFQAIMPIIGYFLGSHFSSFINTYSHWIAFILLGFIGGKMIFETFSKTDEDSEITEYRLDIKETIVLAIATSIDALAVGLLFTMQTTNIFFAVGMIGVITFIMCMIGVAVGNRFGSKYEKKAEFIGGTVLVLIGVKLLLDGSGLL